jgi:hypothetical protein
MMRPRWLSTALVMALVPVAFVAGRAAAAVPCSGHEADATRALAAASRCHARVEIDSVRTETGQVFANPDGTATTEEYAYPQRVHRSDGTWVPPDPTLIANADGTWSPRASTVDLKVSGGGTGPAVDSARSGERVSLSWPGGLPRPTVAGATATYANVLPGVDLVVTARVTGFSELLVVKTREAAANPRLRRFAFGTNVSGLRWDNSDGGLRAVNPSGRSEFGASSPMMWDSSTTSATDGRSRGDAEGPAGAGHQARMALSAASGEIAVTPDASLLDAPSTVYPVYLDPTVVYDSWTMINSQFPAQSYWSFDRTDCPPGYTSDCAKVGMAWGTTMVYRSMFQFSTASYTGTHVTDARFGIDLLHSAVCDGNNWTQLRLVSATLGAGTTWNSNASAWSGTDAASVNNQTCTDTRTYSEFAGANLTATLQTAANSGWTSTTWGLKAADESNAYDWKKFDATTAKLIVTVNHVPNTPSTASMLIDNKGCATGAARPYVATTTPTVSAVVSDPDGGSLTASVEWGRLRYDGSVGPASGPVQQALVTSGYPGTVTLPAGVLDKTDAFVATGDWDGDGHPDIISRDAAGDIYLIPGAANGYLQSKVLLGWGYSNYTFAGMADWDRDGHQDFIVRDNATGNLWLYPGNGTRGQQGGARFLIGVGWNGYTFFGIADWDHDGNQDIITEDPGGTEWLYPGESTRTGSTQPRVSLGSGWGGFTPFGTIDWDRDGKVDVIARDPSGGQLWLYVGSGVRAPYGGTPYRFQIGSGWGGYAALTIPDVNADLAADIVAQQPGLADWLLYPGSGARSYGGARWTIGVPGLNNDGVYAYRASAYDGIDWSAPSGWCEFGVDTVPPDVPTTVGDVYPANCASCGSVGQTGRFTFSDTSTDVVSYRYGWTSPPSTVVSAATPYVDWTPTAGGPTTLYVSAVDRAGNVRAATPYQFYVAPPTPATARWTMDETVGTTLTDNTGNLHTATVAPTGVTLGVSGRIVPGADGASRTAAQFDGSGAAAATSGPVVADTTKSFSVAAWVKLGDNTASHAALSQGGANNSAFILEYEQTANVWKFTAPAADSATTTYPGAAGYSSPRVGVWTHLVGVYDSAAKTLSLYVNGHLERVTPNVTTWRANGAMLIGSRWSGAMAEVQVWNRAVSAAEVSGLADPTQVSLVGQWDMSDVGPGPTYDASGLAHDLNFYPQPGGPVIPPGGSGHTGTGLSLDGVNDYAVTDADPTHLPVLHTNQSFTVSTWVWINSGTVMTQNRTAIGQDGVNMSGFFLGLDNGGGSPQWSFRMKQADTDNGPWDVARSQVTLGAGDQARWIHLTAVYDAQTGAMRLYVDGVLVGLGSHPAANAWDAAGGLTIGRGLWTPVGGTPQQAEFWSGNIDEVRAYQGVADSVAGTDGSYRAQYFNNQTLTGTPTVVRTDPAINFDWGAGSPDPAIPADHFSARWTSAQTFADGAYTFVATADDGVRLWVDGVPLVDKWIDQSPTTYLATTSLTAGVHIVVMEYYENMVGATAKLAVWPAATGAYTAQYFANQTLTGPAALTRTDATVNFDWGAGSPGAAIPVDHFSARWLGAFSFTGGDHTFSVTADDGVRLYIDDQLVIDHWVDQSPTTYTTTQTLSVGVHVIRMEYYENAGGAVAKLNFT